MSPNVRCSAWQERPKLPFPPDGISCDDADAANNLSPRRDFCMF
jgi:hypothetical protein